MNDLNQIVFANYTKVYIGNREGYLNSIFIFTGHLFWRIIINKGEGKFKVYPKEIISKNWDNSTTSTLSDIKTFEELKLLVVERLLLD